MRVLSGMQPSGTLHIGNYFGALVNWRKLQDDGNDCFFFIANQHAITVPQDGELLKKRTIEMAATFFAAGLNPNNSTIFVQSDVPEHTAFNWILNTLAPLGLMERMIQFKEKSERHPESVNLGLLAYPVLQAADVMLYKADLVPVGVDQAQHLELTRELIKKFNNRYKEVIKEIFPEPKTLHTKITKVVGLDGKSKMSKGYNNYIGLTESKDVIWEKISHAVTDPARIKKSDPGNPNICNIYSLHKLFGTKEDLDWVDDGCRNAKIGCIECKKRLFQNLEKTITPIREKYEEWMSKPDEIRSILKDGAKKARTVAKQTLDEVYDLVGFKY